MTQLQLLATVCPLLRTPAITSRRVRLVAIRETASGRFACATQTRGTMWAALPPQPHDWRKTWWSDSLESSGSSRGWRTDWTAIWACLRTVSVASSYLCKNEFKNITLTVNINIIYNVTNWNINIVWKAMSSSTIHLSFVTYKQVATGQPTAQVDKLWRHHKKPDTHLPWPYPPFLRISSASCQLHPAQRYGPQWEEQ